MILTQLEKFRQAIYDCLGNPCFPMFALPDHLPGLGIILAFKGLTRYS
ncbi:MAG: hypothetical protein KME55_30165 [Nostoc indistinguendum CM1-VF10]|jgi:hypothetical protein|nr:hypothetical protein [Nostoc indistinguendum CM1-VF10]